MKHLIWRLMGPIMAIIAVIGAAGPFAVASAAPEAQRTQTSSITFNFQSASFSSILGGSVSGSATLAGQLSADGGGLSTLSGELNFPLRDPNLRVMPTSPIRVTSTSYTSYWYEFVCDPYCRYIYHTFTQTTSNSSVPVEVRSNSLHGNGNLTWTTFTCTAGECPPGYAPGGSAGLSATMVSSQDAGSLTMYGPVPLIR